MILIQIPSISWLWVVCISGISTGFASWTPWSRGRSLQTVNLSPCHLRPLRRSNRTFPISLWVVLEGFIMPLSPDGRSRSWGLYRSSCSAGKSATDQAFADEMKEVGCVSHCLQGNVADRDVLERVIGRAQEPIAGVLQMAMLPQNVAFVNMNQDSWTARGRPKIQGTWDLHNLLPKISAFRLDLMQQQHRDSPEQSNNASANLSSTLSSNPTQPRTSHVRERNLRHRSRWIRDMTTPSMASRDRGLLAHCSPTRTPLCPALRGGALGCPQYIAPLIALNPIQDYRNSGQVVLINNLERSIADPQSDAIWKRDPHMAIYRTVKNHTHVRGEENEEEDTQGYGGVFFGCLLG